MKGALFLIFRLIYRLTEALRLLATDDGERDSARAGWGAW